jgi:hypothetical protein
MVTNEKLVALGTEIEELRLECHTLPYGRCFPFKANTRCHRCHGRGWIPIPAREAAWVLMEWQKQKGNTMVLVNGKNNRWHCSMVLGQPDIQADTPWDAIIDAAYDSAFGGLHG